jgi:hypothetical protein
MSVFSLGTFYEDFDMNFDVKEIHYYLHDDSVPVHSYFTITDKYTESQKRKMFIADVDKVGLRDTIAQP